MGELTCHCGEPILSGEPYCEGGHDVDAGPPPTLLVPTAPSPVEGGPLPDAPSSDPTDDPGTRSDSPWVLVWVDNVSTPVRTPALVGRSLDSPLAKALRKFDFVSREHLVLDRRGGRLLVVDDSRYGTTDNDRTLPRTQRYEVDLPVMLRLADQCEIWVEEHEGPA